MTFRDKAKAYARGDKVENPPESMRLFFVAEAMRWSHLPVAGGIYDQHPQLLKEWIILWEEKAAYEEAKRKQEDARKGKSPVNIKGFPTG